MPQNTKLYVWLPLSVNCICPQNKLIQIFAAADDHNRWISITRIKGNKWRDIRMLGWGATAILMFN